MGPFIPSITLTNLNKMTRTLFNKTISGEAWPDVAGKLGKAMTSRGRLVKVWKANPDNSLCYKYFCHGFALDTYRRFGY